MPAEFSVYILVQTCFAHVLRVAAILMAAVALEHGNLQDVARLRHTQVVRSQAAT